MIENFYMQWQLVGFGKAHGTFECNSTKRSVAKHHKYLCVKTELIKQMYVSS